MFATSAQAYTVPVSGDPGGEVMSYVHKYEQLRQSGEQVVVDGPCLSACTLMLGILPASQISVTRRAMFGFHAASYYDDITRSLVPTRRGSQLVMSYYSPFIQQWINRHGGLTPHLIKLHVWQLPREYQRVQ